LVSTLRSGDACQWPYSLWCLLPEAKLGPRGFELVIGDLPAGFSRCGIDPVGETFNVPDTPLGSCRLVVSPPASTGWIHPCSSHKRIEQGCRHCMRALWLRTTLRKQLLGHPRAMPGVWGRFALHRILPRKEFMGSGWHLALPWRARRRDSRGATPLAPSRRDSRSTCTTARPWRRPFAPASARE